MKPPIVQTPDPGSPRHDLYPLQVWFLGIIAFAVILFLLVQAKFLLISLAHRDHALFADRRCDQTISSASGSARRASR